MFRGIHSTSVQVVGFIWPLGAELHQKLVYFWSIWTHKIKTKAKYISISNILHLLSAPVSITRVETIWDCLVVT